MPKFRLADLPLRRRHDPPRGQGRAGVGRAPPPPEHSRAAPRLERPASAKERPRRSSPAWTGSGRRGTARNGLLDTGCRRE
jgi:hypothetical protein